MADARKLTEILEGVAKMRKVVDYVQDLQRRTNQPWLEFSSPHCRMHVEDYMNQALAHYWQLLMDGFDATGSEADALREATNSFGHIASDYVTKCLYHELSLWSRYGYKTQREAAERIEPIYNYTSQFIHVGYGRPQTLNWIDGSPLDPDVARRMEPN